LAPGTSPAPCRRFHAARPCLLLHACSTAPCTTANARRRSAVPPAIVGTRELLSQVPRVLPTSRSTIWHSPSLEYSWLSPMIGMDDRKCLWNGGHSALKAPLIPPPALRRPR